MAMANRRNGLRVDLFAFVRAKRMDRIRIRGGRRRGDDRAAARRGYSACG